MEIPGKREVKKLSPKITLAFCLKVISELRGQREGIWSLAVLLS